MKQSSSFASGSLQELVARKKRREKQRGKKRVISSGWKANIANAFCLIAALLMCLAHFEYLQADADYKIIEFGDLPFSAEFKMFLDGIVRRGHWISLAMFLLTLISIKASTTRFTFTCLLALIAWPINAFLHIEQNHHHDYLISRLALSAFTLLITTATMFLPKKLKRRKRPNTFHSAFSVASTSTSKQTTQFNTSQCSLENRTIDFDDDHATLFSDNRSCRSINTNGLLRSRIPQYEKIESRMLNKRHTPFSINNDNRFNSTSSDTMSLRSGRTIASVSTQPSTVFSNMNKSKREMNWREKRRESTPMREVRELIDDLLIKNNSTEDEDSSGDECNSTTMPPPSKIWGTTINKPSPKTPNMLSTGAVLPNRGRKPGQHGPFSSLTFNPAVKHDIGYNYNNKTSSPSVKYINDNPKTSFYGDGSSCSSLSSSRAFNSSPFRKHL